MGRQPPESMGIAQRTELFFRLFEEKSVSVLPGGQRWRWGKFSGRFEVKGSRKHYFYGFIYIYIYIHFFVHRGLEEVINQSS